MEEAPKIERVVASQGISISDTAKILTSYLSKVNHHHHQGINFNDTSKDDNTNLNDNDEGDYHANNKSPIRKSKQEREEDFLIAQMDQLANIKSSGMISDDIYERLNSITQSITAEVEGRTISACGLDKNKEQNEGSDDNVNDTTDDGANDFQAGQSEKHTNTKQQQEVQVQQPQQQQQTNTTPKSHREKKKAKKDKKAAKKAKKEAKRKAKEMEEDETITTDIPLHRKKKIY